MSRALLKSSLPFVAGSLLALLVIEVRQEFERTSGTVDEWLLDLHKPDTLWPGEPTFDWGD